MHDAAGRCRAASGARAPAPGDARRCTDSAGLDGARPARRHRGEMLGAAEAVALDQDCASRPTTPRLRNRRRLRAGFCRRRAARSLRTIARHLRHARGRRARARAKGKTCRKVRPALLDERQRVLEHRLGLGREAGDEVGAEGDVGPQRARTGAEARCASARRWRRFMRFRIMSSPACSERCRCGISRGSLGDQARTGPRRSRPGRSRRGAGAAAPAPASGSARTSWPSVGWPGRSAPQLVMSTPVSTTSLVALRRPAGGPARRPRRPAPSASSRGRRG